MRSWPSTTSPSIPAAFRTKATNVLCLRTRGPTTRKKRLVPRPTVLRSTVQSPQRISVQTPHWLGSPPTTNSM